jgi:K+-sensing histidine kinase KdpD
MFVSRRNQATANGLNRKTPLTRSDEMERPPILSIDIPTLRPGTVGAYAFAILSAGVALVLRLAIDPYVEGIQYVTFYPAVIITTLISGLWAGLFCLLLSIAAVVSFLLEPRFSFQIESLSDALSTLLFVLLTFSNVVLIAGMRFVIEGYQELSRKLEQHDQELREREKRLAERSG